MNSWGRNRGESWNGVKGYFRIKYGEVKCDAYSKYGVHWSDPDPWTKRRLHNGNLLESGDGALHRNFELCVAAGGMVQHWWRDNLSNTGWHLSTTFGSGVLAVVGLLQGSYGFNLECIVLLNTGHIQHWWRDGSGWHPGSQIV